jgi:hypothetical protein
MAETNWVRDGYEITCDPSRQNRSLIAEFLSESYWAKGIPAATVEKSLDHSLCFSLLEGDRGAT